MQPTVDTGKSCLTCGRSIKGRSDKKFCDDYCRSAYNNRLNAQAHPFVRNINNILRRNRRILAELLLQDITRASRTRLQEKGFNFGYITHTRAGNNGLQYQFCYEYGYRPLENDWYSLIKEKNDCE